MCPRKKTAQVELKSERVAGPWFALTLARRAIDGGFASRAAFVDARGHSATRAMLLSTLAAACRVRVDGEDDAPLIAWARG